MRPALLVALLLAGCASARAVLRDEAGTFSTRDYLHTAWQTLTEAETDPEGHRIRAQLETRAALDGLGASSVRVRKVPYEGPPTLAVALELLERSERDVNGPAQVHTQRALAELRQAVK